MTAHELGNTYAYPSLTEDSDGMTLRNHMIVEAMKASIINQHYGIPTADDRKHRADRIIGYVDTILEQTAATLS